MDINEIIILCFLLSLKQQLWVPERTVPAVLPVLGSNTIFSSFLFFIIQFDFLTALSMPKSFLNTFH